MKERKEPVLALGAKDRVMTVDYGRLSKTFISLAAKEKCSVDLNFNTKVTVIFKKWGKYLIHAN